MIPLLICSVLALAIIIERFYALRVNRVAPSATTNELWRWIKKKELNSRKLRLVQGILAPRAHHGGRPDQRQARPRHHEGKH